MPDYRLHYEIQGLKLELAKLRQALLPPTPPTVYSGPEPYSEYAHKPPPDSAVEVFREFFTDKPEEK